MCYDILALLIKPSEVKNIRGEGASPEGEDGESPPPSSHHHTHPPSHRCFRSSRKPIVSPIRHKTPILFVHVFFSVLFHILLIGDYPNLIDNAVEDEAKVFYKKMAADYYRYLAEFNTQETKEVVSIKAEEV